ncbi:elongation of very long chain fatty acids protein 5-like [Asterias rubens]|uniref:elongation of very long chain fatty acids protein 5-like n=1 Tax=Asterias rubens TaxID=7604 RepID=UPI0014554CC4|nr:elongation of very long chain fatty acids protein 5-like [Asterias rubens]
MGLQKVLNTFIHLYSFGIMVGYLLMVLLSPLYQKISKPMSLRPILVVYNYACSLLSVCTFAMFAYGMYDAGSVFRMESTLVLKQAFLLYRIAKYIELLDTVFMILRHKRRQISFLHVYHHGSMINLAEFSYLLTPWAAVAFSLGLNSLIHVCLYFYYGRCAANPDSPPSWKKQMTQLQIAQFFVILVHCTVGYLYHGFCGYSIFFCMTMIYLFGSFYVVAFLRSKQPKDQIKSE